MILTTPVYPWNMSLTKLSRVLTFNREMTDTEGSLVIMYEPDKCVWVCVLFVIHLSRSVLSYH